MLFLCYSHALMSPFFTTHVGSVIKCRFCLECLGNLVFFFSPSIPAHQFFPAANIMFRKRNLTLPSSALGFFRTGENMHNLVLSIKQILFRNFFIIYLKQCSSVLFPSLTLSHNGLVPPCTTS